MCIRDRVYSGVPMVCPAIWNMAATSFQSGQSGGGEDAVHQLLGFIGIRAVGKRLLVVGQTVEKVIYLLSKAHLVNHLGPTVGPVSYTHLISSPRGGSVSPVPARIRSSRRLLPTTPT